MTNKAFPFYNDAVSETGASLERADGSFAEAKLYNMLRAQLPPEWSFIWGTQLGAHEYDFLVMVPGKGIVNLECKGHKYKFIGATNRFEIYDKETQEVKTKDLLGQAAKASKYYLQYLKDSLFGHGVHWGLMGYAVVFPLDEYHGINLDGLPIYRQSDCQSEGVGLVRIVNESLERALAKLKEIGVMNPTMLSNSSAEIIWHFWTQNEKPEVYSLAYKKADLAAFRANMGQLLTVSQSMALDAIKQFEVKNILVEGTAGAGKTYLAVAAAMSAECRVLFVCFNKVLSRYLSLTMPDSPNVTMSHYHGLPEILLNGFTPPARDAQEDEKNYFMRVDDACLNAARKLVPGSYRRFDLIIVDEAQDLTLTQLRFLMRFRDTSSPEWGKMILFSSKEQRIYPNRLGLEQLKLLLPDIKSFSLKVNLRNPKSVSAYCDGIIGETTEAVLDGPEVVKMRIRYAEINEFLRRVLMQYNPRDVAVISPVNKYLTAIEHPNGVSFFGPDTKLKKTFKNLKAWYENKGAWKSTTYVFKGLEAMAVVHFVPEGFADEGLSYVGASRATYQLYVCEIIE